MVFKNNGFEKKGKAEMTVFQKIKSHQLSIALNVKVIH